MSFHSFDTDAASNAALAITGSGHSASNGEPAKKVAFRKTLTSLLAAAAMFGFSNNSYAAQATTTMNVSLIIQAGCAVSATALNFGTASILSTAIDQTSSLDVTCTDETAYQIGLDAGAHSNDVATRRMLGPAAETVAYTLYQDNGRTTVWGNTQGGNTVSGTGIGVAQTYTVYGRVFGPQASPDPGGFADLVNVFVYF